MKNISYHILLAAATLAVCGCQDRLEPDYRGGFLSFNPCIGGIDGSEMSKSSLPAVFEGGVELPFSLEVSDGIAGQARNDGGRHAELDSASSPETKGTLLNAGSSNDALSNYVTEFHVRGWKNGAMPSQFLPASGDNYEKVSYSNSKWSSTTSYSWDGSDAGTFYAYANLPSSGASVTNASATAQTLTYSAVPTSASDQNDILLGYYSGNGVTNSTDKTCTADIVFYHPLTSVKFAKGTIEGVTSITFKGIYINGVYKSGKATMSPTTMAERDSGDKFSWTDLSTTMQEVSQESSTGLTVDNTGYIGESFLLIPQSLTSKPVTITIVADIVQGGVTTTHAFPLTLSSGEWKAGKTYTYWLQKTADNANYTFSFTALDGDPLHYVQFDNTVNCGVDGIRLVESSKNGTEAIGYSAYYSTDNGATWIAYDGATTGITGLSATGNTGLANGSDPQVIDLIAHPRYKPADMYLWKGGSDPEMKGSSAAPIDLSKLPIGGEGSEGSAQHTANCYIVKHAGYYKFPCIYGNGVFSTPLTGDYVLSTFINAKGNPITSKYILSDVSATAPKAAMLWTDFSYGKQTLVSDVQLNGSGSSAYISFRTPARDDLAEGNAVIVLYDDLNANNSFDSGEALWSWHIWVSKSSLGIGDIGTIDTQFGPFDFMSTDIGWCGRIDSQGKLTVPDPFDFFKIKLVQDESGLERTFSVFQFEANDNGMLGNSSFFEYGRKDPFASQIQSGSVATSTANKMKTVYWGDGTVEKFNRRSGAICNQDAASASDGKSNIAAMIKNPGLAVKGTSTDTWYMNLWSLNNSRFASKAYGAPLIKTIYDPSPYGYIVPNPNAFNSFTTIAVENSFQHGPLNGTWSTSNDPIEGATVNTSPALFFPACGYINYYSTDDRFYAPKYREGFYSWTSAPGYTGRTAPPSDYQKQDRQFAVVSHGNYSGGQPTIYPLVCFNRGTLMPVRPVLNQEDVDGRPTNGTVLFKEDFGNVTNVSYLTTTARESRTAYTYCYATTPTYMASADQRASIDYVESNVNATGAYLYINSGPQQTGTWTVTISNIKTWGATKVKLSFTAKNSPYSSGKYGINGATVTTVDGNNSSEFTLTGSEDTISIQFTHTKTKKNEFGHEYIDNIVLTYIQ